MGSYTLVRRLATGGMAEVFLAKALGAGGFEKPVAVKRVLPHMTEDQRFVELFMREARLTVTLQHHNVVQVLDLGTRGREPYMVLELVDGENLRTLLKVARREKQQIELKEALFIVWQVAEGLAYAHERLGADGAPLNLVHRDINPANVLISASGEVKLADFGIARAADVEPDTQAGVVKGKPGYLAPEQVAGEAPGQHTDVFLLGLLLYELLVGKPLFHGQPFFQSLKSIRAFHPSQLERPEHVPMAVWEVLCRTLAPDPRDRLAPTRALAEQLESYLFEQRLRVGARDVAALFTRLMPYRQSLLQDMQAPAGDAVDLDPWATPAGTKAPGAVAPLPAAASAPGAAVGKLPTAAREAAAEVPAAPPAALPVPAVVSARRSSAGHPALPLPQSPPEGRPLLQSGSPPRAAVSGPLVAASAPAPALEPAGMSLPTVPSTRPLDASAGAGGIVAWPRARNAIPPPLPLSRVPPPRQSSPASAPGEALRPPSVAGLGVPEVAPAERNLSRPGESPAPASSASRNVREGKAGNGAPGSPSTTSSPSPSVSAGPAVRSTGLNGRGNPRLGELLLMRGVVSLDGLETALRRQRREGGPLGELLLEQGLIAEESLLKALSTQQGLPHLTSEALARHPLPGVELLQLFPRTRAEKLAAVPLTLERRELTCALAGPANLKRLDELAFVTGLRIRPVLCTQAALHAALTRFYDPAPLALSEPEELELIDEGDRQAFRIHTGELEGVGAGHPLLEPSDEPLMDEPLTTVPQLPPEPPTVLGALATPLWEERAGGAWQMLLSATLEAARGPASRGPHVARLAGRVATALGLTAPEVGQVQLAALALAVSAGLGRVHDLGQPSVPQLRTLLGTHWTEAAGALEGCGLEGSPVARNGPGLALAAALQLALAAGDAPPTKERMVQAFETVRRGGRLPALGIHALEGALALR